MEPSLTRIGGTLAAVALAAGICAGPAAADSGELRLTLPAKTTKQLKARSITLAASTPADVTGRRISLPVRRATVADSVTLELSGSLVFKANGRSVGLRSLQATMGSSSTRITALIGKRRIAVMTGSSKIVSSDRTKGTATATGSGAALTAAARRAISSGLKSKTRRRAKAPVVPASFGSLGLQAKGTGVPAAGSTTQTTAASGTANGSGNPAAAGGTAGTDAKPEVQPYTLLNCLIPGAATEGAPPLTAPQQPASETPTPSLAGALTGTGSITWGFKDSLTSYVLAGSGTVYGVGASGRFTFGGSSSYDKAGGRAVITGGGSGVFCYPGHGFVIAIADPTIVIDGGSSRIIATVMTYQNGQLVTGRTDLATISSPSISAPVANGGTTTVTISGGVALSGEGAKIFAGFYGAGTVLNSFTATASYATPVTTPTDPTGPTDSTDPDDPDDPTPGSGGTGTGGTTTP
jgi:hypothetical protein